ncbi:MAG: hypothetical protein ACMXX6_01400 [Candidatus Woesearchaeota archaeon]
MAFVKLLEPWEAEMQELERIIRPNYSDESNLLYIVHPGVAFDCDPKRLAQRKIEEELKKADEKNQRVILIYPTQKGVYIDPTKVTDIRGGADEYDWTDIKDIEGIKQTTFVGGNLKKCLGVCYQNLVSQANTRKTEELRIRLPLDGIYTQRNVTAAQEFLAGVERLGELNSLISLLTPLNRDVSYHKSDIEYGFIYHLSDIKTNIYLNKELMTTIQKKDQELLNENNLKLDLIIEYDASKSFKDEHLARRAQARWETIKEKFY